MYEIKIAKAVATLKLHGGVQRPKAVALKSVGPEILLDIGQPPLLTLDPIEDSQHGRNWR
jgi:hypothetical protein